MFWLVLGGRDLADLPLLLLLATAAAVVMTATAVVLQCAAFWIPGAVALSEDAFNLFLMLAFYPQHPFSFTVRVVLFTLVPTAFVSYFPAAIMREPDPLKALAMLAAAAAYAGIAVAVFQRGLRRYASGNRIVELR